MPRSPMKGIIALASRAVLYAGGCVLLAGLTATAQIAPVPSRVTQAVNNNQRVVLQGNIHPLARAEFDRGLVADSFPMNRMLLVLKRSDVQNAQLEALLADQSEKASPEFHQWLSPEQFGQSFGVSDSDLGAVTDWLVSEGFIVNRVSKGRNVVDFSGNAGQLRRAFGIEIHNYLVNGETRWANSTNPQIPVALAPVVAGINSLNNFPLKPLHRVVGEFAKSKATGEINAASPSLTVLNCLPGSCNVVGPYDFATIYNVTPLWNGGIDGSGETIAIAGDSNINIQDIRNFRTLFGLPGNDPQVIVDGTNPGLTGDETEADLDVEWSGAVAKNAAIDLVIASSSASTSGVLLASEYIVDNNLAPVMSVSFGLCEEAMGASGNQFISSLWQQAAAQGMTVAVATGDEGAANCDSSTAMVASQGLAVNGLASTPYDVAVGGTDFTDIDNASQYWKESNTSTLQASAKSYIPEMVWNDSCTNPLLTDFGFGSDAESNCNSAAAASLGYLTIAGGGGGVSNCTAPTGLVNQSCAGGYAKPSWQAGPGVPSDSKRDLPDVALFSGNGFANVFYLICEADKTTQPSCTVGTPSVNFLGIGGTSAATPAFAAIVALADQKSGARQGNVNPAMYNLAAQAGKSCASGGSGGSSCVFYDVTTGTNAVPCLPGSPGCNTTQPSEGYGVLAGYSAAASYDLATGLGSVNAANLVNALPASGSGNGSGSGSGSGSSGSSSFTLTSQSVAIYLPSAGQSSSTTVTVTSLDGFAGTVNLSCSVSPTSVASPPTCSFSPNSVNVTSVTTATATATLIIGSTAAGQGTTWPAPEIPGGRGSLGALLFGVLLFACLSPFTLRRRAAVIHCRDAYHVRCGDGRLRRRKVQFEHPSSLRNAGRKLPGGDYGQQRSHESYHEYFCQRSLKRRVGKRMLG